MSAMMRHYLAWLLHRAGAITFVLAPQISSYKRFQARTFAPAKAVWSLDNRPPTTPTREPATIRCVSPIDGSTVAERTGYTRDQAAEAVVAARNAEADWAELPVGDRVGLVQAGVARLGEMTPEIVPELARMMGRPVRYGGEFGSG